ncbi:HAD family phosphatase [Robbsia sp. KACC 23696]|uniref:HAD family hydrolase n=1 Tax=Robbsia sp. KACC 23696 TaxID=3149231 RepID=UPI00325AC2E6
MNETNTRTQDFTSTRQDTPGGPVSRPAAVGAIAVPPQPVTHLVCDCDGVLVDSEAVADEAMVSALFATLTAAARTTPRAAGTPQGDRLLTHAAVEHEVGARLGRTIDHVITAVADCFGMTLAPEAEQSVRMAVEAAVRARQTAVPGVTAALHALSASGLPLAVASNSILPRVREALEVAGITALVGERIYTGERVPHPKPAPDVYVAACAGFETAPQQCAAVEDSVTGVTAASGAGMQVIGFAGGTHLDDARVHAGRLHAAGASWVFEHMRDLEAILTALRSGVAPAARYLLVPEPAVAAETAPHRHTE